MGCVLVGAVALAAAATKVKLKDLPSAVRKTVAQGTTVTYEAVIEVHGKKPKATVPPTAHFASRSLCWCAALLCAFSVKAQDAPVKIEDSARNVAITVQPGVPLRLYLTQRLTKRMNEPVQAKLLEPLYAFDREVAPAGADAIGRVTRLEPVSKRARRAALMGGDFTPLHRAQVQFTAIVLPGGRQIALNTFETEGLDSVVSLNPPKRRSTGGKRGVVDMVRDAEMVERFEDVLVAKLPYHPQWIRKGTRFNAELREPVRFGDATLKSGDMRLLGTQPPADAVVHARLVTPLTSKTSKPGEKVEAIVSRPLFSGDNKLILPEGTHLTGVVTLAHRARWFHRGGQLRFNFEKFALPSNSAEQPAIRTTATLIGTESTGKAAIQVDREGSAKTVEPKTRFLNTAIAVLIAANSTENDSDRGESDSGARTLGGASGLGLANSVAGRLSRNAGMALGFYGLAGSIYRNIIARGVELEFANNSAIDIRFGARR